VTRLSALLAVFFPALFVALPTAGDLNPVAVATALTAGITVAALVVATVALTVDVGATPVQAHLVTLRECARLAAFLRLRDPDAPGRTRPRAPSGCPAA
jgi:uncharacterized protein DUF6412